MPDRTTDSLVTFKHAFQLAPFDVAQPAGAYRLVIDEEEVLGLSFLAYRRTATMLHTPAISAPGTHRVFPVDPAELATALETDAQA